MSLRKMRDRADQDLFDRPTERNRWNLERAEQELAGAEIMKIAQGEFCSLTASLDSECRDVDTGEAHASADIQIVIRENSITLKLDKENQITLGIDHDGNIEYWATQEPK